MPSVPRRLLVLLQAAMFAGGIGHAQVHEEKPTPGLEEGLLFHAEITEREESLRANILAGPESVDVGTGDFTVCFWAMVHNMKLVGRTLSKSSEDTGWVIDAMDSVEIRLRHPTLKEPITMKAPIEDLRGAGDHHIAIVIKRDARQPLSGIWIDGIERISTPVPPVNLSSPANPLQIKHTHPFARLKDLRVYNRALTRPDILELQLRSSRREDNHNLGSAASSTSRAQKLVPPHVGSYPPVPKHPAPPPNGPRFIPQPDETIALIGGTDAVALAESGELEALLLMAFPQTRFHFRSLAWEGDTVFRQDRPMNFGSLEQQLRRVNAGTVFVMFGRQECLDAAQAAVPRSGAFATADQKPPQSGKNEASFNSANAEAASTAVRNTPLLGEFKTAFGKLLDTIGKVTPNIVVIGPPPFEKKAPPLPDISRRNLELNTYNEVIRGVTDNRGAIFASVIGGDRDHPMWENLVAPGTIDGVQLARYGCRMTAIASTEALGIRMIPEELSRRVFDQDVAHVGRLLDDIIRAKARLWHHYWRPSNWAFLHGDRTQQPSSRDPVNPQIRLFPSEQERYLPLIKDAEDKIYKLVEEAQKKLP